MRELSLFSGAGGGLLGAKLLGWTHVGYVEFNDYCQRVLAQRIKDGFINDAPIFGDIRAFIREGFARSYQGMADIVTAGFPCQPFSQAGKQQGSADPRNMWPATLRVLSIVRPRFALLENVPRLLSIHRGWYFGRILRGLAKLGFTVKWGVFSAEGSGAPHIRKRLWLRCDTNPNKERFERGRILRRRGTQAGRIRQEVPHTNSERIHQQPRGRARKSGANSIHAHRNGSVQQMARPSANSNIQGLSQRKGEDATREGQDDRSESCRISWWDTEPNVGRVANGVASRMDRIKAIGNGQVPDVVRRAWEELA